LGEDDSVEIGREPATASGSGKPKSSSKSGRTPTPKPGSDSDVRLVADGSDLDFQVSDDSRIRLEEAATAKPSSSRANRERKTDSDVRMIPPDVQSDSDVKIVEPPGDSKIVLGREGAKKASDSDIRLEPEKAGSRKHGDDLITEEIDLDAELRAGESSLQMKSKAGKSGISSKSGIKGKSGPTDGTAPFELSDPKLSKGPSKSDKKKAKDSSSDFELTPGGGSPLELAEDEVQLGELTGKPGGSGINLQDPADSGISLEQGGSDEALEFELKDDGSSGPRKRSLDDDSDSEFELSLDPSESPSKKKKTKAKPKADVDSDSEFELTLDDSGDLLPIEGEVAAKGEEEADIFETDFEVPALDEDSGSQAVALDESDSDVESSDFDLALGEEDVASEEESGSQVVAIEEEEAEPGASTVARSGRSRKGLLAEDEEGLLAEDELESEAESREYAAVAAPTAWGPLPVIIMVPCVIVMFLVTLISLEQIQSMWGYHNNQKVSSTLSRGLASMVGLDVKD
jgi:hypothetical protein